MAKKQFEFHDTDNIPWEPVKGHPGAYQRILNKDLETSSITKLVKYDPNVKINEVLRHDFYEEVYIISGGQKFRNFTIGAGDYAYRHPGMVHGPCVVLPEGCLMLVHVTY